ncbi:MAG: nicotinamide mononucleotide transporter [Oscillospiraceae bacterium]|nr:nicotinamide mononucleotide transporter [Oscillospiraceae bacterium]
MSTFKKIRKYFSKTEITLWCLSVFFIITSFCIFDKENYLTLTASLIGVTSLIFNAKGNPAGQILMIIFSIIYGMISLSFRYYGEMITYLGMTAPMALIALISWLKNPYGNNHSEVKIKSVNKKEISFMLILALTVTVAFYFILNAFNTANIIPSTISVTTSFIAMFLTYKRNPYFALAYASNDIILIILWSLAAYEDKSYISVIVCFIVFLVNDIYGFINWLRMQKRQATERVKQVS